MGDGPNPFEGFDLSQLMRMLQSEGPVNWEVARQVAANIAVADPDTGAPRAETPVDTSTVVAYDAVVRAAQLAVIDATGLGAAQNARVTCVDRRTWAEGTLTRLHGVLEALAGPLRMPLGSLGDISDLGDASDSDPLAGLATVM